MRRDMNLESWKIFAAVARRGSISASVEELGIDAPAVSRALSSLEKSLGTALFDRTSHAMALTDNGREALEAAESMLARHDALVNRLKETTDEMRGPIRVGIPPALLQSYLVPFLVDFSKRYPGIGLEASEYTAGLPIDFSSRLGPLDVVISYGPDPVHQNYVQIHYGSGRFLTCAAPSYLARYGTPKSPEELAEHIGIVFNSPIRESPRTLTKGEKTVQIRFRRELAFSSALSAKSATLFGAGINPGLAELHAFREIERGELVPLFKDWKGLSEDLYIYTRPELMRLKRVRTFVKEYREAIGRLFAEQDAALSRAWIKL